MSNTPSLHQLSVSASSLRPDATSSYSVRAIELRPYQLLCLICMLGEREADDAAKQAFADLNQEPFWSGKHAFLERVLKTIQDEPDIPIVLRCNAGGVFAFQDPGDAADSPEGHEYNLKRDLDILQRLDLAPGATMPARSLLYRAQNHLKSITGVCGYEKCTSCDWQGCPKAKSGFYERGNKINIDDYIPVRTNEQRADAKMLSLNAMYSARSIRVRPHLLMCTVCQYAGNIRAPFEFDNLPEFLILIREKPQTPVTLVPGADWMMCAPCKRRNPETGSCVNVSGLGGLSNDLRDLNVLQLLGMKYGDTLPAGELYRRLFELIPTAAPTCSLDGCAKTSTWYDVCRPHPQGNPSYTNGRAALMAESWPAVDNAPA